MNPEGSKGQVKRQHGRIRPQRSSCRFQTVTGKLTHRPQAVTACCHCSASFALGSCVNLLLQETTLAPTEEWRPTSTAWWFVRLASGVAYWIGQPESIALEVDSLLVLGGASGGCIRASQLSPARLIHFCFEPDAIVGVFTVSDRNSVAVPPDPHVPMAHCLGASDPLSQEFAVLCNSRSSGNSLIFRCQLLGFAVRLLNASSSPQPEANPSLSRTATQRRIGLLVERISDSDLIRFNSEQLAEQCGCSVRHFRRLFRQVMGVSLQEKQSELRMLKARQLLLETDMPVVEVSLACGFHHQSLFHSMFRHRFQMTPGQWRIRQRETEHPVRKSLAAEPTGRVDADVPAPTECPSVRVP